MLRLSALLSSALDSAQRERFATLVLHRGSRQDPKVAFKPEISTSIDVHLKKKFREINMEDLFAIEELATTASPSTNNLTENQQQQQTENNHKLYNHLIEIHSKEDPVLLQDTRILNNLILRQNGNKTQDYFKTVQTEVKPHMRKIVSDWMLEVTEEQQCQPEVFHLAINYLDRYLATRDIKKNQFQLIASVCMFLASKFKETCPLPAEHLVIYTDYSVKVQDIMVSSRKN